MTSRTLCMLAATALALAMPAVALATEPAPSPSPPPARANMQGDQQAWIKDPHIHAFYELTVAAFANGPDKVDKASFERDAFAIFRDFGRATGVGADAMQEHLKLIPD